MTTYRNSTDASYIYRETSALSTIRTDSTSDTGNLLQVIRDSTLLVGPQINSLTDEQSPISPNGGVRAISKN